MRLPAPKSNSKGTAPVAGRRSYEISPRRFKCGNCGCKCIELRGSGRARKGVIRSLAEMGPGERGKIAEVRGNKALCKRIMDMGIVPDAEVEVERIAPLGDPVEIKIKGYHLSLRREEAANIYVEVMAMPLTMVGPGAEVTLVAVNAGRGLVRRLADMGLCPGATLRVIQSHPGPLLVQLGASRLALGHGIAHKISVRVI